MERYRYGDVDDGGGVGRWGLGLILAVALAAGAYLGGKFAASRFCSGEACDGFAGATDTLLQPFVVLGDTLNWAMAIAILLTVFLWFAMSFNPRKLGIGLLLLIAIALLGFLFPKSDVIEEVAEEVVTEPIDLMPESEPMPEPEIVADLTPECPSGNFYNGEGCSPCTETATVPQASRVYFSPLSFDAAWKYANDQQYYRLSQNGEAYHGLNDLVIDGSVSAGGQAVCASSAILVIGSASSDGPRDRNEARAVRRTERLASRIRAACPNDPQIFAISLGQSTADSDTGMDRALTVIGLDTADGSSIDAALVEQELGYVLESSTHGASLLNRYGNFPRDRWQWVEGNAGAVDVNVTARPFETVTRLRDDAPEKCLAEVP